MKVYDASFNQQWTDEHGQKHKAVHGKCSLLAHSFRAAVTQAERLADKTTLDFVRTNKERAHQYALYSVSVVTLREICEITDVK